MPRGYTHPCYRRQRILEVIREKWEAFGHVQWRTMGTDGPGMYAAAKRHFGGWRQAVQAASFPLEGSGRTAAPRRMPVVEPAPGKRKRGAADATLLKPDGPP